MNLDDFLVPSSIASPAGLSPSPSGEKMLGSSAIPIRKTFNAEQDALIARTAPIGAPIMLGTDFGYVQRHVRKTSIDERRVSLAESKFETSSQVRIHTNSTTASQATS